MEISSTLREQLSENILKEIDAANNYAVTDPQYLMHLEEVTKLTASLDYPLLNILLFKEQAFVYYLKSDFEKAILYTQKAIKVAISTNNRSKLVLLYCNLSSFYLKKTYLSQAIEFAFEALKLNPSENHKELILMNLGVSFRRKGDAPKALHYFKKAIEVGEKLERSRASYIYTNIGNTYYDIKEYAESILFFEKALNAYQYSNNDGVACITFAGIARALIGQGKPQEALEYIHRANKIAVDDKLYLNQVDIYQLLAKVQESLKQFDNYVESLQQALALANKYDFREEKLVTLRKLYQYYFQQGEILQAYEYQSQYIVIQEEIINEQNEKKANAIIEKKEREIDVLKEQNEELQQYAYIIAHDLQEPLRNISGFTNLLKEEIPKPLSPKAQEYMEFLGNSSQQIHLQLKGLLEYIDIRNDNNDILLTYIDVKKVVEQISQKLIQEMGSGNTIISHSSLPLIYAHQKHLQKLFFHLLYNAISFRDPQRDCRIHITYTEQEQMHQFCIEDNGIGIAADYLPNLFRLFSQIDKQNTKGVGIGLAICQKIVRIYGGNIYAESDGVSGTKIFFSLKKK